VSILLVRDTAASAATVRRNVTYDLRRAGISEDVAADVAVLASELVANAVRHARALPSGHLQVEWDISADGITIAVTDGGSAGQPQIVPASPHDTSGRGLAIVDALADDWGVRPGELTTTVWARVAVPAAQAG
jgi:anti-sigma regulatory factor (Ser/Thr protein kinase)